MSIRNTKKSRKARKSVRNNVRRKSVRNNVRKSRKPRKSRKSVKKSRKSRKSVKKSNKRNDKKGYAIRPTVIPTTKPFPPTWEIKFFRNLTKEEQVECAVQVYNRGKDKDYCDAFKDKDKRYILARLRLFERTEHFMIVYDNEILNGEPIGLIGFMWYYNNWFNTDPNDPFSDSEFYMDKITDKKYLVISTVWSCTFTTNREVKDHYAQKKIDYDISVAKYLKINLLEIVRDQVRLSPEINVDYVMTYGCSLKTALERHEKNGALIMTDEELDNFVPLNKIYKSEYDKGNHFIRYNCEGNSPIYWVIKV